MKSMRYELDAARRELKISTALDLIKTGTALVQKKI